MEAILISEVAESMAKLLVCVKQKCQNNVKKHTLDYLQTKARLDAQLTNGVISKNKHHKGVKRARKIFLNEQKVLDNMTCTIRDCTDLMNDTFYKFSMFFKHHCEKDPGSSYCDAYKQLKKPILKAMDKIIEVGSKQHNATSC